MKNWLLTTGLIIGGGWIFMTAKVQAPEKEIRPEVASETRKIQTTKIKTGSTEYTVALIEPAETEKIILVPNYEEKLSADEISAKYQCSGGINGGFYGENNSPLGLVISAGREINREKNSRLFNGFVWVNPDGRAGVGERWPDEAAYVVQTGPLLWKNFRAVDLNLQTDKPSRRMVAGETQEGRLIFLAIYDGSSVLDGPNLAAVPQILDMAQKPLEVQIKSAVNLDGGSASAFTGGETKLTEWMPIGSWWCVR